MRRIGHDGLNRRVMGEDFVVRVEDRTALSKDRLLIDVLFRRQPGELVVPDHLQVDQPERKHAE